jgi:GDPmannose 4,6-dehydratase
MTKRALITGISGQDGSYLAEYLLGLGYQVFGLVRRGPDSIRWLRQIADQIELFYGDLQDATALTVAIHKAWPDELYNLAGQVFVPVSWQRPAETFEVNVGGLARLLHLVEREKPDTRVYQASSSEMFGNFDGPCSEETPFRPTSPYGVSKVAAHRLCEVYRAKGLFVVGGILFNHESPRRGTEMVTRKITMGLARWATGDRTPVRLGNLNARRDWGFAGDYVRAMHAMLQQPTPKDYVIGTGESHSVAEFVAQAVTELNGAGGMTHRMDSLEGYVEVDPLLLRPAEIYDLCADPRRARYELGWKPEVDFPALVRMMVQADLSALALTPRIGSRQVGNQAAIREVVG